LFYYSGGSYRPIPQDDVSAKLLEHLQRDYFNVKRDHVANAMMHLKSKTLIGAHIDAPVWLSRRREDWPELECISTKSGIVHLPSIAAGGVGLIPPTPRFFTTAGVDYPFDINAPLPAEWIKFLTSLWENDPQSIQTLCEFFGYLLTQDTSQQKLLMIVGPKRSGKGTILRILRALVGASNVAAPTLSSLCERFGLWPMLGKSVAVISDARLSGRADQAIIVERILSITGEDAQTIDRKNLAPVTVKLPTRFVIVTNELPRLGDASGALVSRMLLLKTTNSFFGSEDHGLTDRLSDVTSPLITSFATRLREKGNAEATIARHLRHLKAAMRWANAEGHLMKLPKFTMPKRAKGAKAMRGRAITTEEFERMLAAVPAIVEPVAADSWRFFLRGLWLSGLRLSESLTLRWDDKPGSIVVDLGGRRPMLRIPAEAEKGFQDRLLPITPQFAQLLQSVPEGQRRGRVFKLLDSDGSLFPDKRWDAGRIVSNIGTRAGVVVDEQLKNGETVRKFASCHDLRRSFGRRLADSGVSPNDLRELMRHSDIATTMLFYIGQNAESVADRLWAGFVGTLLDTEPAEDSAGSEKPLNLQGNAVDRAGIEPATPGFSVLCSTN
jgi:integrase